MPKISALPIANSATTGDLLVIDQSNVTKRIDFNILQSAFANSSGNAATIPFSQSGGYPSGTVGAKLQQVISVKDAPFNAKGDGVTDDTAAIQAALNTASAVYAPAGTYLYTSLVFDTCPMFCGDGQFKTLLKPTSLSGNTIWFGKNTACDSGYFANFGIVGNSTTTQGIQIGNTVTLQMALNCTFEKVRVSGFTGTNAAGWYLQQGQDINCIDCASVGNYRNIYRPNVSNAFTTFTWGGKSAILDQATGDGALVSDGALSTFIIEGTIRSCAKSAIKVGTSTNNNNGNKLILDRLFLENNNTSNTGGLAEVDIAGPVLASFGFLLVMQDVEYWAQAHTMQQLRLDYVGAYVKNTSGGAALQLASITDTVHSVMWLEGNSFMSGAGANYEGNGFPAFNGQVFYLDKDSTSAYWFQKGTIKFLDGIILGGSLRTPSPRTGTNATDTITSADTSFIANRAGTITLTLENAVTFPGRILIIRTIQNQAVVSAGSNVVPLVGGAAGTAILAATAGKWALLQSDGANWQIMAGN